MKILILLFCCTWLCGYAQAEQKKREVIYVLKGLVYPRTTGAYPTGIKVSAIGVDLEAALSALADSARLAKANGAISTQFFPMPNGQIKIEAFLVHFSHPGTLDSTVAFILE